MEDNCFQDSAAVSFYTLFSLAPAVLIAVYVAGFFVGDESVLAELTRFLNETIGRESTDAVLLLVDTIKTDTRNFAYLAISIVFLMVSATTVFVQFKESFNRIFGVKSRPEIGFLKVFIDRLTSFSIIIMLGLALIISLILDSILVSFFDLLANNFEFAQLIFAGLGSNLVTILMIFLAVFLLFYILPDVKLKGRPVAIGSLVTTILLVIGKFGVGMIIGSSSLNQLSGASSSIIILMLWVYYSSIIVFFGVELVKSLAESGDREITAGKFARRIKMVELSPDKKES